MKIDIMSFTARLAETGVIDEKTRDAFLSTMSKGCKDPRFPDFVDSMLETIKEWHTTAGEIGYTTDPILAKTVSDGMKLALKFAKSNVSNSNIKMSVADDYGKKLTDLGADIARVEQKIALNPGGKGLNIRQETLEMLKIYKDAINQQKSVISETDTLSLDIVNSSLSKVEAMLADVDSAVDISSKDAAILQKEMFTAINSWEFSFSYGNFNKSSLEDLDKAVNCAKRWSLLPLNIKAKQAKEGDYIHKDNIGTRTLNFAGTYDAIAKINQAIGLIDRAKVTHTQITDSTRLEQQKEDNIKDLNDFKRRIEEIKYLATTRQIDLKAALAEKESLEKRTIPTLQKAIQNLDTQILGMKQRRTSLKMTLMQIENVCYNFLAYKNEPRIINLFAEHVNFVALTNFLGGSNTTSTINDIINLAAIEKITQRKFDEANDLYNQNLDSQLNELEPVNLYEEAEEKVEMSEEDMLKLIMGDSDSTNTVTTDLTIENPNDYTKLSLTDDDN